MPLLAVILAASLCLSSASGQSNLSWRELPFAPVSQRHNDTYFVDSEHGWIVNGDGEIYRTANGGDTWALQLEQSGSHFRSVGFLTEERGFAGQVGFGEFGAVDFFALYETSDGGTSWSFVESYDGPGPAGLCGMHVVNDSVVVAVGRVRGPAVFVRSDDAGQTWQSTDMSAYADGLIDVYFPHPDSGFAVGLTNEDHSLSSGVILATTDGGETWEERFVSSRTGEWCWKMSFPSRRVGYVSLQRNSESPIFFLKTSDGGVTWEEKLFRQDHYFVQGIGFVTDLLGWIGGNSTQAVYMTEDGGDTWQPEEFRPRLNRFRFLSDTLGYAVGRTVHKLEKTEPVGIDEPPFAAEYRILPPPYPNPFGARVTIPFDNLPSAGATLAVFDVLGRRLRTWSIKGADVPEVTWDALDEGGRTVPAGVYLLVLESGSVRETRTIVRAR